MIQTKNKYFNGREIVVEIYHETHKIFETTNGELWNATFEEPITVTENRFNNGDYIVSAAELEKIEENIEKSFE